MNKKNIRKLIDRLKEPGVRYDQHRFNHSCGTPACIAGHVIDLAVSEGADAVSLTGVWPLATQWLGITQGQSLRMFDYRPKPWRGIEMVGDPTVEHAIDMLERFLETGKVKWRRKLPT